jgi:hypothetical protein
MAGSSDELSRFVRDALGRGIARAEIDSKLREAGWSPSDVARALRGFAELEFPLPVPRPQPYLSAREAFFYLLLFTTLFMAAFNLGRILFELIEKWLPDAAGNDFSASDLRWGIAFVVVSFPVYLFLTLRQQRELERDPAQRASRVRKWLTYLTLLVAAAFLIGDMVALIFYLLEGELTLRFVLKVCVVALIPGAAFLFYLRDLAEDQE